jgi:hypothetical protein
MSAPDTTVIQMNFKTMHGGLFNIYATSVAEAKELTQAFREELVQEIHDTEAVLMAASAMAATSAPTVGAAPPQQAAPAAPSAGFPSCDAHGQPMRLVPAGISKKTGKPYKAFYSCAQPQATSCGQTKYMD